MINKFPYIEVSGTYEDVGHAIGEEMKDVIVEDIDLRQQNIKNYNSHLEKSKEYYEYTKSVFPNLIDEMNAIALAAGVSEYEYFFVNNREVYDPSEEDDAKNMVQPDHCTSVVSFNSDGAIIGHNEDWDLQAIKQLYILKATVNGRTFLGVNYAATVPGVAASMNDCGLVQCINDLYQTNKFGIPKNFLARAILECKDLHEAENLVSHTNRASGFNHVLIQGKNLVNIEIAGDKMAVERVSNNTYVHTNHYLSKEMKHLEKFHTKSSQARYLRALEIIKTNMTTEDMKSLLSDTKNSDFPICRKDDTIASIIFEPSRGIINICRGHPCAGEYFKYNL